ncbi:GNAT family N-acetyltransferase [Chloroflexota bacterium]
MQDTDGATAVVIRQMSPAELEPSRIAEIDVSEHGDVVLHHANGQVETAPEEWYRSPLPAEGWVRDVEKWRAEIASGGAAIGAFAGERLIGIAVVRNDLTETSSQLSALFVSRDHRRRGVARQLTDEACRFAREAGAQELYVSAIPSRSAVGFYTSHGFRLANKVNKALYELEPEDIHMIRAL